MGSGGGGGGRESTTQTAQQATPQIVPELRPFVQRVGELSRSAIDFPELGLQRFATDTVLPVPGLSPMEQFVGGQVSNRLTQGIPTPLPEQVAFYQNMLMPGQVSQQVPLSQFTGQGLGTAGQIAQQAQQPTQFQQAGLNTLQQFAGGQMGNSQAVQQAVTGLQNEIVPAVQNQAARSGLAESGFLPQEIGRAYARELVPLYQQGLQQQQQAGNQLYTSGADLQDRQLRALQALRDAQMGIGGQEQALQTESLARNIQASLGTSPELRALGTTDAGRTTQALQEGLSMGQLQRSVGLAQAQAELESFLRSREMALGLVNPFGSFGAISGIPPSVTTERTMQNTGGGGMFK